MKTILAICASATLLMSCSSPKDEVLSDIDQLMEEFNSGMDSMTDSFNDGVDQINE